jgi:hypothetical protein
MREPSTRKLAESRACLSCANYWQSVLRFGLPFIVLFEGIDYLVSRITGNAGFRYPWWFTVIISIAGMLVASALWWALMREIATWKLKGRQQGGK